MRVVKEILQVGGRQWVREKETGVGAASLSTALCYLKRKLSRLCSAKRYMLGGVFPTRKPFHTFFKLKVTTLMFLGPLLLLKLRSVLFLNLEPQKCQSGHLELKMCRMASLWKKHHSARISTPLFP
jgi:hypothetical protein